MKGIDSKSYKIIWMANTPKHYIGQVQLTSNKFKVQFYVNYDKTTKECFIRTKNLGSYIKINDDLYKHKVIKSLFISNRKLSEASPYHKEIKEKIEKMPETSMIDCIAKFNRQLSQEELEYVHENNHKSVLQLAKILGRTPESINHIYRKNNDTRKRTENLGLIASNEIIRFFNDTSIFERLHIKTKKVKNYTGYYCMVDIRDLWKEVLSNKDKILIDKINTNHRLFSTAPNEFVELINHRDLKYKHYTKATPLLIEQLKYYKYNTQMTNKEIASQLGIKLSTVKNFLRKYIYHTR